MYVVGGGNNTSGELGSVHYLPLGSDAWRRKKSMPRAVRCPLVIQHQYCIFVLGGLFSYGRLSSGSQQYNIKGDTWKQCSDMIVACSNKEAGVVVHEDRIKVITVDKCLMYDDDTDTWTVKPYQRLGYRVNAFVRRGQIWATVGNGNTCTCSMMSYNDVDNVWKTEHERIDNAWYTRLFC